MRIAIAENIPARIVALLCGLTMTFSAGHAVSAERPTVKMTSGPDQIVLTSGRLQLVIKTRTAYGNPCSLRDLKSGRVYADGDYAWPKCVHPRDGMYVTFKEDDGTCRVVWTQGRVDSLDVKQEFSASPAKPDVITEQITLHNPTDKPIEKPSFACGFTKKIHDGKNWLPGVADSRFCDIPYRRHPETGELCDWTVPQLVARKNWFSVDRMHNRRETPIYGAEGWAWYQGGNTLLISKYNPDAMEWSLLETTPQSAPAGTAKSLRLGGAGRSKLGNPKDAPVRRAAATITVYPVPGSPIQRPWSSAPVAVTAGLVIGPEGRGIARWLNRHGIAGVVLAVSPSQGPAVCAAAAMHSGRSAPFASTPNGGASTRAASASSASPPAGIWPPRPPPTSTAAIPKRPIPSIA